MRVLGAMLCAEGGIVSELKCYDFNCRLFLIVSLEYYLVLV